MNRIISSISMFLITIMVSSCSLTPNTSGGTKTELLTLAVDVSSVLALKNKAVADIEYLGTELKKRKDTLPPEDYLVLRQGLTGLHKVSIATNSILDWKDVERSTVNLVMFTDTIGTARESYTLAKEVMKKHGITSSRLKLLDKRFMLLDRSLRGIETKVRGHINVTADMELLFNTVRLLVASFRETP